MKLKDMFSKIQQIADDNKISKPYLVGGVPRDKIAGVINKFNDLDITNGDNTIKKLSFLVSTDLGGNYKEFDDGHSQVTIDNIKLDFSSNFISSGVRRYLQSKGIKNPTRLQEEAFSRDFTINTLLLDLGLTKLEDPTGLGLLDIKAKTIRTCMPARITLRDNARRVVRAIYLAAKLDFKIDKEIIDFVKNNKDILKDQKNSYSRNKLKKAMDYNFEKTVRYMNEMDLWDYFELPGDLELFRDKGKHVV